MTIYGAKGSTAETFTKEKGVRTFIRLFMCTLIFAVGLPAAAFAAEKLPSGFIALSESEMNWSDAKAFCQQQGGRLPLINGSSRLSSVPQRASVDGFGTVGTPWPSAPPKGRYWAGTEDSSRPDYSCIVLAFDGKVRVGGGRKSNVNRVICVPSEAEHRATEEAPKAKEARKAEEAVSGVSVPELTVLQKTAELGNAQAQFMLGNMYLLGQGVPRDFTKSAQWFQKAAEQGHVDAQFMLGAMHVQGQGVPKDYAKAAQWLQKPAEQENAEAQFILGMMYANGLGVPQNYAKAIQWHQKAAEQGYIRAQNNLGHAYRLGQGVAKDEVKAVQWYQKAAERGDAQAQFNLGLMYAKGQGIPQDDAKAMQWIQKAAEQGFAPAQDALKSLGR